MLLALAAGAALVAEPRVLDTLAGDEFARAGITGEILERPAGIDDEEFARQVMEADGLRPWHGAPMLFPPAPGEMGTMAITAADGREINVKYVIGDRARPGRICRLRLAPGVGAAPVRWNAYRWCAAAFGVDFPETVPPPLIVTVDASVPPALGDFDHDGVADRAYVRHARGGHELVVERGRGGIALIHAAGPPETFYYGVLAPGTYRTACGKGLGAAAAPCPERSVTLDRPALEFGGVEASQAVVLWQDGRFRVVWLSD